MLLLTTTQKVKMEVQPSDADGNPARIDGMPVWNISDAAIGTLAAAPDGMSCYFLTTGVMGTVQVSVTADADLGAGVRALSATLDISVEAGEAVTLGIRVGTPEPR